MLKLVDIKKDYGASEDRVEALKGITIDFRDKEFAVILGPSGCGKTTLMNIIGGLDKATSGELIISGVTTKDYKDRDWDDYRNKRIGFVFQNYNLISHLTVLENVEIALTISGVSVEERRRKSIEVLEKVGLKDKLNKRPNELSGGQMQRVAIARALVNDPEILLADEPSGALDSTTSGQIMDLIKEVFADKLVLMVTHNPSIAEKYGTRIVTMLDGLVVEDSNPLTSVFIGKPEEVVKTKKAAMPFLTALKLSWKNLFTKRGRTVLTSFAGSIGIVGVALILSISGGMNNYITNLQRDTLASNPITISENSINMTQAFNAMQNNEVFEKFPEAKEILVQKEIKVSDLMTKNNLNDNYITYLNETINPELYNDIIFKTGMKLNFYGKKSGQEYYSEVGGSTGGMSPFGGGGTNWQMMLKTDFTLSQYDVLEGTFPANANEIVVIVNAANQIPESVLVDLGIKTATEEVDKYQFSAVIGREYKLANNDDIYLNNGSYFSEIPLIENDFDEAETLKVVGVLRIKPTTDGGVLGAGIGYLKELYTNYQTEQANSEIVQFMRENPTKNPLTGLDYVPTFTQSAEAIQQRDLRSFGGNLVPNEISVYPVNFDAKEEIKQLLNDYNIGRNKDDMVTYTDMSELLGDSLSQMVNIISWVLIAFTAISLLVSSVMIGIITFVSVIERTKEIGILRSVGARKKDVTRIFNAETIIIGFFSGVIGVALAYLLAIPINLIINNRFGVPNIASLNLLYALILILISVGLTLISGLIPAKRAAKLDPVKALRTE